VGTTRKIMASLLNPPRQYARMVVWDNLLNTRHARGDKRFLVVHHPSESPFMYDLLLHWLAMFFPDVRALFELHTLPFHVRDWSRVALYVPWLQDPVQAWSRTTYWLANRLAARCDRHDIPVINRVDRLANASKSSGARLIGSVGFRTPQMAPITDVEEFRRTRLGLPLPLFVREDQGHGGPMLRADTDAEVRALPIESLRRPVAVELIDVRSPGDGLFRKFRYVLAGDVGVRQTLHVTQDWATHGTGTIFSEALREEEVAFIEGVEPEHARFLAAREALGLDFVAFDYGIDVTGRTVVWEANPFPFLHFVGGRRRYRMAATERVLAAMARLYLSRSGMDVPADLDTILGNPRTEPALTTSGPTAGCQP